MYRDGWTNEYMNKYNKDLQQVYIKMCCYFLILEMLQWTKTVSASLVKSKRNLKVTKPKWIKHPSNFHWTMSTDQSALKGSALVNGTELTTATGGAEGSCSRCTLPCAVVLLIIGVAVTAIAYSYSTHGSTISILGLLLLTSALLLLGFSAVCRRCRKRRKMDKAWESQTDLVESLKNSFDWNIFWIWTRVSRESDWTRSHTQVLIKLYSLHHFEVKNLLWMEILVTSNHIKPEQHIHSDSKQIMLCHVCFAWPPSVTLFLRPQLFF